MDARIGQQSLGAGKPYGGDDKQRDTDDDESETLTMHGRTRRFFEPQAVAHAELVAYTSVRRKRPDVSITKPKAMTATRAYPGGGRRFICGVIGITFDHETPPCAAFKIG